MFFSFSALSGDFLDAIENHEHERLRALAQNHEQKNFVYGDLKQSPLHLAVAHACPRCLIILLNAGASPFTADASGSYPLAYALRLQNPVIKGHIVYRLLESMSNWRAR